MNTYSLLCFSDTRSLRRLRMAFIHNSSALIRKVEFDVMTESYFHYRGRMVEPESSSNAYLHDTCDTGAPPATAYKVYSSESPCSRWYKLSSVSTGKNI